MANKENMTDSRFLQGFCDWYNDPKTWKKPRYTVKQIDYSSHLYGGLMIDKRPDGIFVIGNTQGLFLCKRVV